MKKYLNILSAIILGAASVTFIATARGQLDSTRDAAIPKVISPEEAAKKYPLPAGKKEDPPAVTLPTSTGGFYPCPYLSQVYNCSQKNRWRCGALRLRGVATTCF